MTQWRTVGTPLEYIEIRPYKMFEDTSEMLKPPGINPIHDRGWVIRRKNRPEYLCYLPYDYYVEDLNFLPGLLYILSRRKNT